MSSNIIRLYSYIDKALFKAGSHQSDFKKDYILSIQIALDGFSFTILDQDKNKYLALEKYTIQEIDNYVLLCEDLNKVLDSIDVIKRRFNRVIVLFEGNKSALVPNPLFDENAIDQYLKFNYKVDSDEVILYDKLINLQAYNVFAIPQQVRELIKNKFVNYSICHFSSSLIESLLIKHKNQEIPKRIFINVRESSFDIVVLEDSKLAFFNSFPFRTKEDFVYFIIFVLEQLKLNPENVDLTLMGEIDKSSKLYEILFKYVRNIQLMERNDFYSYSYVLDDIPSNHYYNLLNASLCEL